MNTILPSLKSNVLRKLRAVLLVGACAIIGLSCKKIVPEPAPKLHVFEFRFSADASSGDFKITYTYTSLNQKSLILVTDTVMYGQTIVYHYKQGELHSAEATLFNAPNDSVKVEIWVDQVLRVSKRDKQSVSVNYNY